MLILCSAVFVSTVSAATERHVVVVVWDAMRPDFVTEKNAPNLCALARGGVTFANHHSVYLSATEVNGTAISTGAYPARSGIISNHEYRPDIDPLKAIGTEEIKAIRKGDEVMQNGYLAVPTVAERVQLAGKKTAVAGSKPVALLANRAADQANGSVVFAGATLPTSLEATLTQKLGPFPKEGVGGRTRNDWTTDALLESLWSTGVPDFSLLWLNEPDSSQHATAPGSARSLAAIRNADENLGKVLKALGAKGARDSTDVIVVSDHGCSTITKIAELANDLNAAGIKAVREFKTKPNPGDVLVVANSGSSLIYVVGGDRKVVEQVVNFLQGWKYTGVIFTRAALPGTFPMKQAHLDSPNAPEILISMRWTAEQNTNGAPGMLITEHSGNGPNKGSHVSLSPYDMHNTLIAAGPDFRVGVTNSTPSGNVDIAPTVMYLLGIPVVQKPMDGRVLTEALRRWGQEGKRLSKQQHLEAKATRWHQYLDVSAVEGVEYCDEGNGGQTER
jgi:predicted AlkP superfamily pyrophosphatase or phosphodiesterase